MKRFIVAVVAQTDDTISINQINAATWQEAFRKCPAVWWNIPDGFDYDEMQKMALRKYCCHVTIEEAKP